MYGVLDLNWLPTSKSTTPPAGRAPAIVRGDDYAHVIRITGGWAALQTFTFDAQIRAARLTGATAGAPLAAFTVQLTQNVADLLITISLASAVTLALQTNWFWDLQISEPSISTVLAGKGKTLDDVTRVG